MNYYQNHIGDYRRDTAHLSLLEHGVYRQLLDWYYLNEKPIPKETQLVFRRLSARTEEERKAVELVLSDFFTLSDDGYRHARCDKEIATYKQKADTARANGRLGGRPKTQSVNLANQEETGSKANHKPLTNNHKPIKPSNSDELDSSFDEFWKACPKKVDKQDAKTAWKNLSNKKRQIALVDIKTRYAGTEKQFIPSPAKYLRKEKWTDEVIDSAAKPRTDAEWVALGQAKGIEAKPGESSAAYSARVQREVV